MQNFSASPLEMVSSFWRNKGLICNLVYREVVGRYKGSMLGIFWSLATPVFMLAVYTFVFSGVFKARWISAESSQTDFALILFAGLLIFNVFSECVSRAPSLVLNNVNYVKKIVFPLEILPWVTMGGAIFHLAISLCVWIFAYILLIGMPHWTLLLFPLLLIPFVFLVMGFSWFLASLGVYLRDIEQLIGIFITVLMFLSPIFFPVSALPASYQWVAYCNPLSLPIEMVREILYWGNVPSLSDIIKSYAIGIGVIVFGFAWFQKTRKGFSDVI